MSHFRKELPAEGLARIKIELAQGDLTVRAAAPEAAGYLESTEELETVTDGDTLRVRQPRGLARLIGETLVGEQRIRVAVEGNVLLDRKVRFGTAVTELLLPASVGELLCSTGRGEIQIEGVDARIDARSGKGDLLLRGEKSEGRTDPNGEGVRTQGRLPSRLSTGAGNVQVRQHQGDLEIHTGHGEIRIEDGGGRLSASTGNGSIVASGLSGPTTLKTGRGDIVAADLRGARLSADSGRGEILLGGRLAGAKVDTGRGEIVCRLEGAEGEFDLQTGGGDITLDLLEGVEARVDVSTRRGSVESVLPLVRVGSSGPAGSFSRRLVGTVGGSRPAAKILLHTQQGDIRIGRASPAIAAEATLQEYRAEAETTVEPGPMEPRGAASPLLDPPAPPRAGPAIPAGAVESATEIGAPIETTPSLESEILEAVGRGELSVDEALLLLERTAGRSSAPEGEGK